MRNDQNKYDCYYNTIFVILDEISNGITFDDESIVKGSIRTYRSDLKLHFNNYS